MCVGAIICPELFRKGAPTGTRLSTQDLLLEEQEEEESKATNVRAAIDPLNEINRI